MTDQTHKLIDITLCQDCPKPDCPHRTLCGSIPESCPLPSPASATLEEARKELLRISADLDAQITVHRHAVRNLLVNASQEYTHE